MSTLTIHLVNNFHQLPPEDFEKFLSVASKAGDEFSGPNGGVLLIAVNRLKYRGRSIFMRIEGGSAVQETVQSLRPGEMKMYGPFSGADPLDVTVKLTYLRNRGLRICAVSRE